MLSLRNLMLRRGNKLLFSDVNLTFYLKQKIGIVGKNGSGKSSLFALILQLLAPDEGEVAVANNAHIAYIDQEVPASDQNVMEYVIDADVQLRTLEGALQAAVANNDGMAQASLLIKYEALNGYTAKSRVATLLHGLGFTAEDQQKTVNELSGGLKRRLNLARTLFVPSEILLLDEPTNHLDLETVVWLEKYLIKYTGLALIISHDRDFLDNIVTHIANLEQQKIKLFVGNYSAFEKQNALQLELQQKGYIKQQTQIAHLEQFINRFRSKASKARQAQSRIKVLEKMQLMAPVYERAAFNFEFFPPKVVPHILVTLENISFAYDEQQIFSDLSFRIDAGMRIGLLGRNGVGKSTLIKLLLKELPAHSGRQHAHHKLQVGYFAQYQLDNLNINASPIDHLQAIAEGTRETELRAFLGRFDFSGDMQKQPVGTFSGGERARLVLALIVWQRPNLLLLDEPTNHLDINMREALAYALQSYTGAMLIVSHDRHLLRATVDDFYLISNKKIARFDGDLSDYEAWLLQGETEYLELNKKNNNKNAEAAKNIQGHAAMLPKEKVRSAKNRLQRIEAELDAIHIRLKAIEAELSLSATYQEINREQLNKILVEQKALTMKVKELEDQWLNCVAG